MDLLHTQIEMLELEGLDLDELEIEGREQITGEMGLESLATGHGMIEIGASSWPCFGACCCSCCCCLP